MDLASIVRGKADFLIGMRRRIHAHPELSGREYETAALVREELTKAGIEWRPCGLQTGTLAEIRGAKPGRTVLLRADMDALPVTETTGASFASCNPGVMHACGHDCHTAMLLTAALVLQETREEWGGVVRLAFQPAEESGEGALSMIAQGALEGVYACFAMHTSGRTSLPDGSASFQVPAWRVPTGSRSTSRAWAAMPRSPSTAWTRWWRAPRSSTDCRSS